MDTPDLEAAYIPDSAALRAVEQYLVDIVVDKVAAVAVAMVVEEMVALVLLEVEDHLMKMLLQQDCLDY